MFNLVVRLLLEWHVLGSNLTWEQCQADLAAIRLSDPGYTYACEARA